MTTAAVPFYTRRGEFAGVTTIDISLEKLNQIVTAIGKNEEFAGQAHALLINEANQVMAIDQPELLVADVKDLGDAQKNNLLNLKQGQLAELTRWLSNHEADVMAIPDPLGSGEQVYVAHAHLPVTGWTLITFVPVAVMLKGTYLATAYSTAAAVAAILVLLGVIFGVTRHTLRPIAQMAGVARQFAEIDLAHLAAANQTVARGDLTVSMQVQSQPLAYRAEDEIGALAAAFNQMIGRLHETGHAFGQMTANLSRMVSQTTENAAHLGQSSTELAAMARQSNHALEQITSNIQQVAQGTARQTASLTQTAGSMEQLSSAIIEVANGAQEQAQAIGKASSLPAQISMAIALVSQSTQASAHSATEATQTVEEGTQTIDATIQGMAAIKEKVNFSAQKMQEMGARSDQIGAIVETIEDIASQTNLLALNAAIEAARAGEHGKGFAVVADEVRKLAEKSAGATKEIAGLIQGIQKTITEAVVAMHESAAEVEQGVVRTGQAGNVLTNIHQAVEMVNLQIAQIAAAAQEMDASAAELVTAMESVSAVVEENTAATQEMAASSGMVTQAIETITAVSVENSAEMDTANRAVVTINTQVGGVTAAAQSLMGLARDLQTAMAQFKVKQN
jgi:methyl-accepting chemotaxis protein